MEEQSNAALDDITYNKLEESVQASSIRNIETSDQGSKISENVKTLGDETLSDESVTNLGKPVSSADASVSHVIEPTHSQERLEPYNNASESGTSKTVSNSNNESRIDLIVTCARVDVEGKKITYTDSETNVKSRSDTVRERLDSKHTERKDKPKSDSSVTISLLDTEESNEIKTNIKSQDSLTVDSSISDRQEPVDVEIAEPSAKRTKLDTEVILIDETNTDSRQSAATDDDVIIVDEKEGTSATDIDKSSTTQSCSLYDFNRPPRMITGAWKCFESSNHDNYLRGCKWAPDGTCLLTNSNDNCIRLFNLPEEMYREGGEYQHIAEMVPVLKMKEADTIYDFCWYPLMSSANPETACLAVTSKDTPIHLYDAFTGELRCSYRAFNHVDEVAAANSLSFNIDGSKLYCGFNKMIRVFDVTRPGREFVNRPTFAKQGQPGIISCIAHSPTEPGLYAAGSYARAIALYKEPQGEMICLFQGQQGGVTQLAFSPDGTKLYSGGRKDPEILCWDMRNPGQILFTLIRRVETNQRIYFDQTQDGRYLVSGSHDKSVIVWDTQQPPSMMYPESDPVLKPVSVFSAHNDTVNGISLHPSLPLIATSSGRRHFPDVYDSDDSDEGDDDNDNVVDNSLKLWWL